MQICNVDFFPAMLTFCVSAFSPRFGLSKFNTTFQRYVFEKYRMFDSDVKEAIKNQFYLWLEESGALSG